ncbi:thymidylate synthase [Sphaerisporangium sp. NPDC088356]|uniref:thymidylate synthase n=1 Tax=Sphaerisporangium sp. NPDC088356 TaxID=3154871 RepID=UPI003445155C
MRPPVFDTFHEAYLEVLNEVANRPDHVISSRGNRSRECRDISFTLTDPRHRTPRLSSRKTNIVFNYAEALWYLAGREDLDMIGYYAPRLYALSLDGYHLTGTAYGARLFGPRGNSQWDRAVELLGKDPDSKRAAMVIMRPGEFADLDNPDVACTLALQFLIRDGRLHTTAFMRGNDAMLGLVCDVFSFTLIAEFTALQLGVPLGSYTHHVASMHLNEPDWDRAAAILVEHAPPPESSPVMPADTSWETLETVLAWENQLRTNQGWFPVGSGVGLPPYWEQVLLLFDVYRQIKHHPSEPVDPAVLDALHANHQWLVGCRWPEAMPQAGR